MKTIKPLRLGLLHRVLEDGAGCHLVVTAIVFFRFGASYPLPDMALWPFVAEELGKDAALDMGLPKVRGELLVTGSAYPYGGARPACAVRVKIGSIDKTLYVSGDRFWRRGAITAPVPFTEMPVTYANAFGGAGHALNPIGKGAARLQLGGQEIHPLPNVEEPGRLVGSPDDRPPPAGFGAHDMTWPQRLSKAGTYDEAWLRDRFPAVAADMDPGFYNAAPPDQQIQGFFAGDEAFSVEHMHPEKPLLEARLPGVGARVFINQKTDGVERFREVPMRLDTVHLFPHAERGVLVFRGVAAVAEDGASDVAQLLAGCEALHARKTAEHYQEVLRLRMDRERGALFCLRDDDLMPPKEPSRASPEERNDMEELLRSENLQRRHARARMEREHANAIARIRAEGLDPEKLGVPRELPPEEPEPSLDDLPAALAPMLDQAERAKAEADQRKAQAEVQARKICEEHGLRYDAIVTPEQGGGPPKFSAAEEMKKIEAAAVAARNLGLDASGLETMLADPEVHRRLTEGEEKLREAYRRFAHHFPAASRLGGSEAARLREEVIAAYARGASLSGRDLTGADLSNLNLYGVDFSGAFLEAADLSGSNLGGADLRDAVLTRSDLARANLSGAKLAGANLGGASLSRADLSGGVDMKGAVLARADLSWTTLEGADLEGADLLGTIFHATSFCGVKARNAVILETDLSELGARGADLSGATFVQCSMEGADFSGANLSKATFLEARGDDADFRGAILRNVRFVQGSSFERADFRGAVLEEANLRGSHLAEANFSEADLSRADLGECDLRRAVFLRARAREARFIKADLSFAKLALADLMQGSLHKAAIFGADFEGANLFQVDFAKARGDERTSLRAANVKRTRFTQTARHHEPR